MHFKDLKCLNYRLPFLTTGCNEMSTEMPLEQWLYEDIMNQHEPNLRWGRLGEGREMGLNWSWYKSCLSLLQPLRMAQEWVFFTSEVQGWCGAWFWLGLDSVQLWGGTASFIVILAFSCWQRWEEDWYLVCDSGCFVEDFGCSMRRILSGQMSHGGTWSTDLERQ